MEKFIKQLARDAGKILRAKFGKVKNIQTKQHALDFLTEADLMAEKLITNRIKKTFPTHAIIAEESGEYNKQFKNCWIVDPLDGTNNFAHATPLFVTQFAYVEDGELKASVVYDPIHDRMFYAEKGKGAFLNGKKIKVSPKTDFSYSQGTTDFGLSKKGLEIYMKIRKSVGHDHLWLRNLGSAGIQGSFIAEGRFDWQAMRQSKLWDLAPLVLLIREAGGVVKNFEGQDWQLDDTDYVAGNPILVKKFLKILNSK